MGITGNDLLVQVKSLLSPWSAGRYDSRCDEHSTWAQICVQLPRSKYQLQFHNLLCMLVP